MNTIDIKVQVACPIHGCYQQFKQVVRTTDGVMAGFISAKDFSCGELTISTDHEILTHMEKHRRDGSLGDHYKRQARLAASNAYWADEYARTYGDKNEPVSAE